MSRLLPYDGLYVWANELHAERKKGGRDYAIELKALEAYRTLLNTIEGGLFGVLVGRCLRTTAWVVMGIYRGNLLRVTPYT